MLRRLAPSRLRTRGPSGDDGKCQSESAHHGVTVTLKVPSLPPIVAVITADPVVTPVTSPLADTVATLVLFEDHVTARPVRTVVVRVAWRGVQRDLVTLLHRCRTRHGDSRDWVRRNGNGRSPLLVSLVAVMVALSGLFPVLFPVTTAVSPGVDTVATLELLVLQLTVRSVTTTPF